MRILFDDRTEHKGSSLFPFHYRKLAERLFLETMRSFKAPENLEVQILFVDKKTMRTINRSMRKIDRETDVLSFPNREWTKPGDFSDITPNDPDLTDPESGDFFLGDVVLCVPKVFDQAEKYGHPVKREYGFLLTHSFLHLCGFDHIESKDAEAMESKQEEILRAVKLGKEEQ